MPGHGRRRWGWHRLEPEWAEQVVEAARVRPGQLVLDLGAGDGALTAPLLAAGARVVAVELHPGRADRLRRRYADADVRVVVADLFELPLPRRPFRVVASPPYVGSAALVRRLAGRDSRMFAADLVLEYGTVRGFVDDRGPRGWRAHRGLLVPRRAFRPPPDVRAAVLVLRRRAAGAATAAR